MFGPLNFANLKKTKNLRPFKFVNWEQSHDSYMQPEIFAMLGVSQNSHNKWTIIFSGFTVHDIGYTCATFSSHFGHIFLKSCYISFSMPVWYTSTWDKSTDSWFGDSKYVDGFDLWLFPGQLLDTKVKFSQNAIYLCN